MHFKFITQIADIYIDAVFIEACHVSGLHISIGSPDEWKLSFQSFHLWRLCMTDVQLIRQSLVETHCNWIDLRD